MDILEEMGLEWMNPPSKSEIGETFRNFDGVIRNNEDSPLEPWQVERYLFSSEEPIFRIDNIERFSSYYEIEAIKKLPKGLVKCFYFLPSITEKHLNVLMRSSREVSYEIEKVLNQENGEELEKIIKGYKLKKVFKNEIEEEMKRDLHSMMGSVASEIYAREPNKKSYKKIKKQIVDKMLRM